MSKIVQSLVLLIRICIIRASIVSSDHIQDSYFLFLYIIIIII